MKNNFKINKCKKKCLAFKIIMAEIILNECILYILNNF